MSLNQKSLNQTKALTWLEFFDLMIFEISDF